MSRRDTIIISVFVNAGLLALLFITAMTSREESVVIPQGALIADANQQNMQPLYMEKQLVEPQQPLALLPKVEEPKALSTEEKPQNIVYDKGENVVHKLPPPIVKQKTEAKQERSVDHYVEVIVKKGDRLETIAKTNRTTVSELMRINNLPNTFLRIGQVLRVPTQESVAVLPKQKEIEAEYYIVKVGDNPWTIAMKHHLKVDELLRLNKLDENKARRLRPGDKLRIR